MELCSKNIIRILIRHLKQSSEVHKPCQIFFQKILLIFFSKSFTFFLNCVDIIFSESQQIHSNISQCLLTTLLLFLRKRSYPQAIFVDQPNSEQLTLFF
jgi:hypothetical protein